MTILARSSEDLVRSLVLITVASIVTPFGKATVVVVRSIGELVDARWCIRRAAVSISPTKVSRETVIGDLLILDIPTTARTQPHTLTEVTTS